MNNRLDEAAFSAVESVLKEFGYSTKTTRGKFPVVAVNQERIIALYSDVEPASKAISEINSSLSPVFFEKRFGVKSLEIYVIVVCEANLSEAERYAIEGDARICRKVAVRKSELSPDQLRSRLISFQPLHLIGPASTPSTEIDKVFIEVLREAVDKRIGDILTRGFQENWDSQQILQALKESSE